ncbi:hypothetical protein QF045_005265 [Pseudomonas sp. W4I3]|nr:hypothetical protein [Pseudomonas sp. W4I3]
MRARKWSRISRLAPPQKPQLACRHDGLHASCTIPKNGMFYKLLFYKGFLLSADLAHCLQYPCQRCSTKIFMNCRLLIKQELLV